MEKIFIFGDETPIAQEAFNILYDCEIFGEIITDNIEDLKKYDFNRIGNKKIFFAINNQYLNYLRSSYLYQSKIRKHNIVNIIHPSAVIEKEVSIGINCLVSYSAHIKAKTKIHNNVFINKAAEIGTNVTINENSWIGIDARIASDKTIGIHTIIGDNVIIESHSIGNFCELTKKGTYTAKIEDNVSFIEEAQNPIYFI